LEWLHEPYGGEQVISFDTSTPILVFGGPYSNLEATVAMHQRAEALGVPSCNVICTGDVVAYCAAPEKTAQLVADWGCHVIQGNCEQQLAVGAEDCACNFEDGTECATLAKGWYPFANARMSPEMRAWMGNLPETLRFELGQRTFRVVHGGTEVVNRWVFQSERHVLAEESELSGADVTIAGHSGLPYIARVGKRVWFNPGVIGMPANDGTADIWYGLVRADDDGSITLSTHRLAYDHHTTAADMRRFGHANGYARTLVTGLWPSLDILPPAEREATGKRLRPKAMRLAPRRANELEGGMTATA
jgi:predicted phosphodiesterase